MEPQIKNIPQPPARCYGMQALNAAMVGLILKHIILLVFDIVTTIVVIFLAIW
jgi:hypothetical protein